MLIEKDLAEALLKCKEKLKAIQSIEHVLSEWKASLTKEEDALRTLAEIKRSPEDFEKRFLEAQLTLPGLGFPARVEISKRKFKKHKGMKKPDVQIMEEVFRDIGPKHVTELVPILRERGVPLNGKKKPTLQVRDKMFGSKRFHNFGNNVWGLPTQELPERYKKSDRTVSQVKVA